MPPVYIYALKDPDTQAVRYVGKSIDPANRLRFHRSNLRRGCAPVQRWCVALRALGKTPLLELLETVQYGSGKEEEAAWIQHYQNAGAVLLNRYSLSQGGEPNLCGSAPSLVASKRIHVTVKLPADLNEKFRQFLRQEGKTIQAWFDEVLPKVLHM